MNEGDGQQSPYLPTYLADTYFIPSSEQAIQQIG